MRQSNLLFTSFNCNTKLVVFFFPRILIIETVCLISLADPFCTENRQQCSVAPGCAIEGAVLPVFAAEPRHPRRGSMDLLPLPRFLGDQRHGGGEQRRRPVPGTVHLRLRPAAALQHRHHPRLPQGRGPLGRHVRLPEQRRPWPPPHRRRHGRRWSGVVRHARARAGRHLPQPDEAVRVPDQPLRCGRRRVRPVLRRLRLSAPPSGIRQGHQGRRVGGPVVLAHGTAPVAAHGGA